MSQGPLIIVSGPSGSGKSTVIGRLMANGDLPLHLSVSATTRGPRKGEIDGVHYYFWTREQFDEELKAGAFLEWAQVHDDLYGTLRREVDVPREQGRAVILDIDVQGAAQIRRQYPDAVSVFLSTPSMEICEARLRRRGSESEASIERRLATARRELQRAGEYDYQVLNDDLDNAVAQLGRIVRQSFERGGAHAR